MNTQKIRDAINDGAPLYNSGKKDDCLTMYIQTGKELQTEFGEESILDDAIAEAEELQAGGRHGDGAWVMRHCFDNLLSIEVDRQRLAGAMPDVGFGGGGGPESDSGWQDETESHRDDFERGQSLADTAHILRACIRPSTRTFLTKSYPDTFEGHEAVDFLTSLGLSPSRKLAAEKLTLLKYGGFVVSVSHGGEKTFRDGSRLYGFPAREDLQTALDRVVAHEKVDVEGSDEHVLMAALTAALEDPEFATSSDHDGDDENPQFAGVSAQRLSEIPASMLSEDQHKGQSLAELCSKVEGIVDVADRTYHLRSYDRCLVGKDAVTKLVGAEVFSTREEAVDKMNELCRVGLVYHVTREHHFKDDRLFYRFSSVQDIKKALDAYSTLKGPAKGDALVQYSALINRYKHITGSLDISSILNDFYGCDDKAGWDVSDLDNWRHNMKRWGFGRREDQDDIMVDRLSPLLLNIDPETWDVAGDAEWESPYGILAQIALFDQVSRSAFRGTPDAFKWDELAKRATRVALEKGYFENAYKSTLNQFVILLPLEHSESWQDQKLGVSLLLGLLSKVAVLEEDPDGKAYSDYEIVKRLEFSKRLSVAFLEHAQVVAKFKRYPHRNRAIGRGTTLEERIWLASDLVPRWAKSQNPDQQQGAIIKRPQLPTIPLKKLTRGR